ncbi:hypothetical protein HERIO_2611 [Hepatospora eriocheir]|uniref:Uncharacterized protein n=1 Tax=Hepatospora eriocheir TaxID=1081669 RepID=A0A1X0Q676_9MICR|nr:hypothetical protein HERIO_2611 [Hepatospora eriocheir]
MKIKRYYETIIKDIVNLLTLHLTRNGERSLLFKMVLSFAENTDNDIKLLICKNLLGILIEFRTIKDDYISNRIITTFEIHARNNYIKQSIHNIINKLIDNDIYVNEVIPIIIDKNHISFIKR